jgi:hypothetical protein
MLGHRRTDARADVFGLLIKHLFIYCYIKKLCLSDNYRLPLPVGSRITVLSLGLRNKKNFLLLWNWVHFVPLFFLNYFLNIFFVLRLTLSLLMSYIYGAPCRARNFNVAYIWTYVRQHWNRLFYLLHNVSTLNQCRKLSCGTVVRKHFVSYQVYPNYRWDLIR